MVLGGKFAEHADKYDTRIYKCLKCKEIVADTFEHWAKKHPRNRTMSFDMIEF